MLNFNSQPTGKKFEITVVVRDKDGKPTGQKKTITSDTGSDLSKLLNEGRPRKKRKRKRSSNSNKKNNENQKGT